DLRAQVLEHIARLLRDPLELLPGQLPGARELPLDHVLRHRVSFQTAAGTGAGAAARARASSNVPATFRQHRFSRTWYSYSSLNFLRVDCGGVAAASPKAQS